MLRVEVFQLAEAHAMFAAAGAAEFQRPLDQTLTQSRHRGEFLCIAWIEHDDQVEVAVAGVTDQWSVDVRGLEIPLRLQDAFGKVRDRDANVCSPGARPRA